MDAAWTLGLDHFDTADAYGGGRSETWIGDWLRASGNRPRITSKTFNAMEDAPTSASPASGCCAVETSLERLGVDRVDLYLTHDDRTRRSGRRLARSRAARRGLIGSWGVSNVSPTACGVARARTPRSCRTRIRC
jgi:aryl-alcohol dehydrogenase-like predicted oxidoreductase